MISFSDSWSKCLDYYEIFSGKETYGHIWVIGYVLKYVTEV